MPQKALGNVTVTYNSVNITQYLNTASIDATVAAIDTTNLASTAQEQSPGAGSWTVPVGGFWAKALDTAIAVDAVSPPTTQRTLVVTIGQGAEMVTYTWTGSAYTGAFISAYQIQATDPMGQILWTGTLTCSGAPART